MMKKVAIWSLLLIFGSCRVLAQRPYAVPLSFVPSDSVVVWGGDRSDFRGTAMQHDQHLQVRRLQMEKMDKQRLSQDLEKWNEKVLPVLDVTGCCVAASSDEQAVHTAEMVRLAGRLFLQTRDARYMDAVERGAWNALMQVLTPGGLTFEKHMAAQALMDVSGMMYATDEKGVYINLFLNSTTHVKTDKLDLVIDQLTAYPHADRLKIRVSGLSGSQLPLTLRLRMPDWACSRRESYPNFMVDSVPEHLPVIHVNGRDTHCQVVDGYVVVERNWNSGDEIYLDFPMEVRHVRRCIEGKGKSDEIAMQRGPLVMGFDVPVKQWSLSAFSSAVVEELADAMGHSSWKMKLDDGAGQTRTFLMRPVMDGAQYVWIRRE